ncbi:hypothetical protein [Oceanomicrobium pacificus]|uniref:Uncharacterized protein n=1 Tax=Oceanomicrobium pacificus TaxID=2692916 RepID=A0A6B0TXA1_9RHOB|nr:hypothetical protein [Oceanomicrobium pacificus]MXU65922.1 hypothetical protein [Oceanomicrobium pacificus]
MIAALIGLVGVVVGSLIVAAKETLSARAERKRNATYSAMRIVCELDHLVEICVAVVYDDGTEMGQLAGRMEDGQEYAIAQVDCPKELVFADDIVWKSLSGDLMYRALALPNRLQQANRNIYYWGRNASLPYLREYFEARQESYSALGLEALALADAFRQRFGMPNRSEPAWKTDRDPKTLFQETLDFLERSSDAATKPRSWGSKDI